MIAECEAFNCKMAKGLRAKKNVASKTSRVRHIKIAEKLMKIGKRGEFESIYQALPGHLMYLYCISLCLFRLQ